MKTTNIASLSAITIASAASATVLSGTFTALTFNVAGLPSILQSNDVEGDKATNAGELGTYFAEYDYDIINMQEDFNYHAYIYATDDHAYRTATSGGAVIGSGLNTISNYDWIDFTRVKWDTCSDASEDDCLTPKVFTFMRWNPEDGVFIDYYNLHADAGYANSSPSLVTFALFILNAFSGPKTGMKQLVMPTSNKWPTT